MSDPAIRPVDAGSRLLRVVGRMAAFAPPTAGSNIARRQSVAVVVGAAAAASTRWTQPGSMRIAE